MLEYRHVGPAPAQAPTIVLLHEGLGCVALWRDFPEALAAKTGYGVFAYSRAGYGASSPCALPRPLTYMHEEAERSLPALLDVIGFREGVLLGHSDGASIAAIYAGSHRDPRLRGLVLMAPHFFTEDPGIAAIAQAKVAFETGDLRERLTRYHGENVDGAFRGWNDAWLDPRFREWTLTEYLPEIAGPTLILQGAEDQYGSERQLEMAQTLCRCRLETVLLPDCRHSPHLDQRDATLEVIAAFLGESELALKK